MAEEKKLPVIAFVEDVGASGGYMIACAADEIICDPSSIVGSIGVVGASFGFAKAIEKLGIERRVYTAGEHKAMLDPFLPENPDDVGAPQGDPGRHPRRLHRAGEIAPRRRLDRPRKGPVLRRILDRRSRRSSFGLVDGIGDLRSFLRERYGDKVADAADRAERGWFGRTTPGVGDRRGAHQPGLADELVSAMETRAIGRVTGCRAV